MKQTVLITKSGNIHHATKEFKRRPSVVYSDGRRGLRAVCTEYIFIYTEGKANSTTKIETGEITCKRCRHILGLPKIEPTKPQMNKREREKSKLARWLGKT